MTGLLVITLLALITGAILGYASTWFRADDTSLVNEINQLLPQTQCAQCGYPGCRPYAEALAKGEADIDQCPPGGSDGIEALAALLDRPVIPLNPEYGEEKAPALAIIRESDCIGCTLCIKACPVDAIVGAPKLMHTVIADHCTGCELCLPPCPVDCIDLVPAP
ncbi:MAG: electron transport complex subunit RsxB [Pseudomonadota bacterium]